MLGELKKGKTPNKIGTVRGVVSKLVRIMEDNSTKKILK